MEEKIPLNEDVLDELAGGVLDEEARAWYLNHRKDQSLLHRTVCALASLNPGHTYTLEELRKMLASADENQPMR